MFGEYEEELYSMSLLYDKNFLLQKAKTYMDWDDELFILEMSIVHVPCVLDFGGAYLDKSPDHLVERNEEWESEKREEFGKNWEEAKIIIREIEQRADMWLADINTGNIKFEGF
jgi:hypothetical protein